jgi:YHS domain-containing protein
LKLAVTVILAVGCLTAWGTIVESKLDADAAHKLVYSSIWMYLIMATLAVNLTAVMIDRWPWKSKHLGFIFAHIGLLVLMCGAIVTKYFGVDGSLTVGVGEKSRHIMVGETDFTVYSSFDGSQYTKLYDHEVDFFLRPPQKYPLQVELPTGLVRVVDFLPYALREEKYVESDRETDGPAIRFQIQNSKVSLSEWLLAQARGTDVVKDLGPAQVVFTTGVFKNSGGRNTIVLRRKQNAISTDATLEYEIHTVRDPKNIKRGLVKPGDTIETGWMGLVFRVLKFIPSAKQEVKFIDHKKPSPLTTAALKIEYAGKEYWIALNSMLKLFNDQAVFVVAYTNRRLDLGFDVTLKEFNVGRYQGTMRAASYESVVDIPVIGSKVISMNEPLKYGDYTVYQASFQQDDNGRPVASVFSVNRDPGRWIKYLGSFFVVFGTIYMFWFKNRARKAAAKSNIENAA